MSIETYPLTIAPDIDRLRVQRVAKRDVPVPYDHPAVPVSSMLGGL
jgi:hypothetical protein